MIMPLGDENRPGAETPYVTWGLIGLNVLVFLIELQAGEPFINGYSAVPAEITSGKDLTDSQVLIVRGQQVVIEHYRGPTPIYLTLLTSMFMHGGWMHLLGNMLYLWVFGDNLEDRLGHTKFLLYYLVCGLTASVAHIATGPDSVIPSLGASGAISGVLGGYLILFPNNRVRVLIGRIITTLPAVVVLGFWIVLQLINGVGAIAATEQTTGVAWWAHIGGFAAGVALILALAPRVPPPRALRVARRG